MIIDINKTPKPYVSPYDVYKIIDGRSLNITSVTNYEKDEFYYVRSVHNDVSQIYTKFYYVNNDLNYRIHVVFVPHLMKTLSFDSLPEKSKHWAIKWTAINNVLYIRNYGKDVRDYQDCGYWSLERG